MSDREVTRSRLTRGATVARLAAEQTVKTAGTHAANIARSPGAGQLALEQRQLEAADQIVRILGTMKGAAMKVGQMLSMLDLGLISEGARPEFQRRLAALRDSAPHVAFEAMRQVVEDDLGGRLAAHFAEFDERPLGAASIGQVYRAVLKDGRQVAVKVQYPGVAVAVRADLKNLALVLRLVKRFAPGLDVDALAQEIRLRVGEELDYALEAENQLAAATLFDGHPFIVVPKVVPELCRTRVLVTEYVAGRGFDELISEPDAVRDRLGEILFRFYFGSLYRLGQFSGDPHPGNFLLLDDGRVAFLDFGLYKRMEPQQVSFELACERAAAEGRATDLHGLMAGAGILPEPDAVAAGELLDYVRDAIGWYLVDRDARLTGQMATAALIAAATPGSPYYATMRDQYLPPEHLLARRVELFTLAMLGQLGAGANWHRIAREWLYGDPPVTELGKLEADFYASR
jgi:predicted unusual protein kinase regulating ubiquinone biosynthesis (AarF/ABC1/UbiB family)